MRKFSFTRKVTLFLSHEGLQCSFGIIYFRVTTHHSHISDDKNVLTILWRCHFQRSIVPGKVQHSFIEWRQKNELACPILNRITEKRCRAGHVSFLRSKRVQSLKSRLHFSFRREVNSKSYWRSAALKEIKYQNIGDTDNANPPQAM